MSQKSILALLALATATGAIALAQPETRQPAKPVKPAAPAQPTDQPELPPGMSAEDMQAFMEAATLGPNHEWLTHGVGVWHGVNKSWMAPDTEPMTSECISTVTSLMDGRYTKCEITGDMPGMGPFHGFGIYGFDNVSDKFQSTWIDNFGTGMMVGTGTLSDDGKTLTWNFEYNCPITGKPTVMREVEKRTGKDTMTLEMFGAQPHTGVEFKMMEISFTRKPTPAKPAPGTR